MVHVFLTLRKSRKKQKKRQEKKEKKEGKKRHHCPRLLDKADLTRIARQFVEEEKNRKKTKKKKKKKKKAPWSTSP